MGYVVRPSTDEWSSSGSMASSRFPACSDCRLSISVARHRQILTALRTLTCRAIGAKEGEWGSERQSSYGPEERLDSVYRVL
jgi:hypothetical protein